MDASSLRASTRVYTRACWPCSAKTGLISCVRLIKIPNKNAGLRGFSLSTAMGLIIRGTHFPGRRTSQQQNKRLQRPTLSPFAQPGFCLSVRSLPRPRRRGLQCGYTGRIAAEKFLAVDPSTLSYSFRRLASFLSLHDPFLLFAVSPRIIRPRNSETKAEDAVWPR